MTSGYMLSCSLIWQPIYDHQIAFLKMALSLSAVSFFSYLDKKYTTTQELVGCTIVYVLTIFYLFYMNGRSPNFDKMLHSFGDKNQIRVWSAKIGNILGDKC